MRGQGIAGGSWREQVLGARCSYDVGEGGVFNGLILGGAKWAPGTVLGRDLGFPRLCTSPSVRHRCAVVSGALIPWPDRKSASWSAGTSYSMDTRMGPASGSGSRATVAGPSKPDAGRVPMVTSSPTGGSANSAETSKPIPPPRDVATTANNRSARPSPVAPRARDGLSPRPPQTCRSASPCRLPSNP
jgi:hypothetical protein